MPKTNLLLSAGHFPPATFYSICCKYHNFKCYSNLIGNLEVCINLKIGALEKSFQEVQCEMWASSLRTEVSSALSIRWDSWDSYPSGELEKTHFKIDHSGQLGNIWLWTFDLSNIADSRKQQWCCFNFQFHISLLSFLVFKKCHIIKKDLQKNPLWGLIHSCLIYHLLSTGLQSKAEHHHH